MKSTGSVLLSLLLCASSVVAVVDFTTPISSWGLFAENRNVAASALVHDQDESVVYIVGSFSGTLSGPDVDGESLFEPLPAPADRAGFVVKAVLPDNPRKDVEVDWVRAFAFESALDEFTSASLDLVRDVLVIGGTMRGGWGVVGDGSTDGLVIALGLSDGGVVWSHYLSQTTGGGPSNDEITDVQVNSVDGATYFVGSTQGNDAEVTSNGGSDVLVGRLDEEGELQWKVVHGTVFNDYGHSIMLLPASETPSMLVGGSWGGSTPSGAGLVVGVTNGALQTAETTLPSEVDLGVFGTALDPLIDDVFYLMGQKEGNTGTGIPDYGVIGAGPFDPGEPLSWSRNVLGEVTSEWMIMDECRRHLFLGGYTGGTDFEDYNSEGNVDAWIAEYATNGTRLAVHQWGGDFPDSTVDAFFGALGEMWVLSERGTSDTAQAVYLERMEGIWATDSENSCNPGVSLWAVLGAVTASLLITGGLSFLAYTTLTRNNEGRNAEERDSKGWLWRFTWSRSTVHVDEKDPEPVPGIPPRNPFLHDDVDGDVFGDDDINGNDADNDEVAGQSTGFFRPATGVSALSLASPSVAPTEAMDNETVGMESALLPDFTPPPRKGSASRRAGSPTKSPGRKGSLGRKGGRKGSLGRKGGARTAAAGESPVRQGSPMRKGSFGRKGSLGRKGNSGRRGQRQ